MSREMSGLDAKRDEEEFLAYATESVANDEFDALIGLAPTRRRRKKKASRRRNEDSRSLRGQPVAESQTPC